MQNPNENWQVEVNGEIYDTTFAELTIWISESSLLQEDKVRRGNLRWLEAGRVPPLKPFFEAKINGTEPPVVQMTVTDAASENEAPEFATRNLSVEGDPAGNPAVAEENLQDAPAQVADNSVCSIHPELEAVYLCEACQHGFCKPCPESFGSSVKICPYCGAMCRSRKEIDHSAAREQRIQDDISEGFGFGDLGTAIAYPFQFKSSLFFGGVIVAILGYGQSAVGMGSMFLIGAAIICFILSSAFVFGMVSNTLNNFAKGEIDSNFLAGLEGFSAWDDVIHPFLLFIGVYVSSFGVATALILGMVWYTINSFTSAMNAPATEMSTLTKESAQSADHVAAVRRKLQKQNQGRPGIIVGEDGLTEAQRQTLEEEAEFQQLNDLANNYRKAQLESTIGKAPETQDAEMRAAVMQFVKGAGVFILLIGLAMLWGFFYFPAACAVAGYTKSFGAAINPMVGLDTIRHLGLDYLKILSMSFLLSIMSGIIGGVLGVIFSPFDLPTFGNLPANFVASFVGFYFWVVFAVLLGLALYKNSSKLKLYR